MVMESLIQPFVDFSFMRKALVAALAVSAASAPLGVFIHYRKMSLTGDALSHGMLPGVALGFILSPENPVYMILGGMLASFLVLFFSRFVSEKGRHSHDSSFAVLYLISLALGIVLLSIRGTKVDLLHILFGNILMISDSSLLFVITVSVLTFWFCILFVRPLSILSVLPNRSGLSPLWNMGLLTIFGMNLVSSFMALGTLLSMGLLLIPVAASSFWTSRLLNIYCLSFVFGIISSFLGLIGSYYLNFPSGPSMVLVAGMLFILSFLFGQDKGFLRGKRR